MRMNIYVPDELRQRMDAVDESVNWSAVACQGFEAKLGEIAQRRVQRQESDMQDVVERLRASKRKADDEGYKVGHAAGASWAKSEAEAVELERLDEHGETFKGYIGVGSSAYSPAEQLAGIIAGDPEFENFDRHEAASFWEMVGEEAPGESYLAGFIDGALEVWGEVKARL